MQSKSIYQESPAAKPLEASLVGLVVDDFALSSLVSIGFFIRRSGGIVEGNRLLVPKREGRDRY